MIRPKTKDEIATMREGGRRHAAILAELSDFCQPGQSSLAVETRTRELCRELDLIPAFLNYTPEGASRPYPAALCFSVNDEIVHGLPNEAEKILQDGDILTLDLGVIYKGLITDAAITIGIGQVSDKNQALINTAYNSLLAGVAAVEVLKPVSKIGAAIERAVKTSGNYSIYRGLVGHGVGYDVHEEPNIPNFNTRESFPTLPEGAVIAIEPMIGLGSPKFYLADDDWTYKTVDKSIAAHVEHTVAVTSNGPIILTSL